MSIVMTKIIMTMPQKIPAFFLAMSRFHFGYFANTSLFAPRAPSNSASRKDSSLMLASTPAGHPLKEQTSEERLARQVSLRCLDRALSLDSLLQVGQGVHDAVFCVPEVLEPLVRRRGHLPRLGDI